MYTPRAFRDDDLTSLHDHIRQARLAMVVTHDANGLCASHVPLLLDEANGEWGTLSGHLAKANPQCQALASGAEVLVIFPGADAYVSPGFYPSKLEHGKVVPTWNYQAVHAYGPSQTFTDPQRLHRLVTALTERHEAGQATPWSVEDAPADYIEGMLKAIVGFSIPIARLEGKRKFSQNRSAADIAGVQASLAASNAPQDQQLARLMNAVQPGA